MISPRLYGGNVPPAPAEYTGVCNGAANVSALAKLTGKVYNAPPAADPDYVTSPVRFRGGKGNTQ